MLPVRIFQLGAAYTSFIKNIPSVKKIKGGEFFVEELHARFMLATTGLLTVWKYLWQEGIFHRGAANRVSQRSRQKKIYHLDYHSRKNVPLVNKFDRVVFYWGAACKVYRPATAGLDLNDPVRKNTPSGKCCDKGDFFIEKPRTMLMGATAGLLTTPVELTHRRENILKDPGSRNLLPGKIFYRWYIVEPALL